jgi:hypothetical protein
MRAVVVIGLLSLMGCPQPSFASTGLDSFFGSWKLDRAVSHYASGAMPEQMTVIIQEAPRGLSYHSEGTDHEGRFFSTHFVARLDSTPALVVGTSGYLAPVSLAQVDDVTIEAAYLSGIRPVASSRWSIAPNGAELRITTTSKNAHGEESVNVALFRRSTPNTPGA